jgi:hypothetical protein
LRRSEQETVGEARPAPCFARISLPDLARAAFDLACATSISPCASSLPAASAPAAATVSGRSQLKRRMVRLSAASWRALSDGGAAVSLLITPWLPKVRTGSALAAIAATPSRLAAAARAHGGKGGPLKETAERRIHLVRPLMEVWGRLTMQARSARHD